MPDLIHSLQGRDLGHLRIVASLWGVELNAPDVHTALPVLVKALVNPQQFLEKVESLPPDTRAALNALVENEGRMSWQLFVRRFGGIREMGPGRRDRERPHLNPTSPSERLWYLALVGRAFLKTEGEPQEYAYLPDEFLAWWPDTVQEQFSPPGRPASQIECACPRAATDRILDHACTLLAALRLQAPAAPEQMTRLLADMPVDLWPFPAQTLLHLLRAADLLDASSLPKPEPVRLFLEARRADALAQVANAWLDSTAFNELRLLPGLRCEGEWLNDALQARRVILEFLGEVPPQTWWSLPSFVQAVRERQPDFQRPAGDYDSWFIRQESSDEYLSGIACWDEVDGALIRFMITGPLHWLGILDLAAPSPDAPPAAFRFSRWAAALLDRKAPGAFPNEDAAIQVFSDGRLRLYPLTPRAVRYQVARFCQWQAETSDAYHYRITPASLKRAKDQGLQPNHLLILLRRHAASPVPPVLVTALERWAKSGAQVKMEQACILRTTSPDILNTLRRTPAARFLEEPLGPTTIVVKPGALDKVLAALAELGYLAEVIDEQ